MERAQLRLAYRESDFVFLKNLDAEIVLLGTGARQRFPHPRLTAALAQAGIGLEVMDLQAACRTYNILVAEERKVAAALAVRMKPFSRFPQDAKFAPAGPRSTW